MIAVLATLVTPLFGAAAAKKSSASTYLILVVIAAAFYFLIFRPQQRKTKAAREQIKQFDVGDEVLTAGGIVGRIIDMQDDRVTIETSVGASFVVLRQYIVRRLSTEAELDEHQSGHDGGEDEDGSGSGGDDHGDHAHGDNSGDDDDHGPSTQN